MVEDSMVEVYKATTPHGSACHFGVESAARAWAGTNGTVERIELRDPPVLTVVPADDGPPMVQVGRPARNGLAVRLPPSVQEHQRLRGSGRDDDRRSRRD